jgi:hypothetical protein
MQGMGSETAVRGRYTATVAIKGTIDERFCRSTPVWWAWLDLNLDLILIRDRRLSAMLTSVSQVVRLRQSYKDGVNSLSAAECQAVPGRV